MFLLSINTISQQLFALSIKILMNTTKIPIEDLHEYGMTVTVRTPLNCQSSSILFVASSDTVKANIASEPAAPDEKYKEISFISLRVRLTSDTAAENTLSL